MHIDDLVFTATTIDGDVVVLSWNDLIPETIDRKNDKIICLPTDMDKDLIGLRYSSIEFELDGKNHISNLEKTS